MSERGAMIVTGGGRGIGAATARLAARKGYAVCVNYRDDASAAQGLVAEIAAEGGRALALAADIAEESAVEALFEGCERALGPIAALVNNAGTTGRIGRLETAETAMLRRVLEVNVLGLLLCCRAAVRRMSSRKGGAGGVIVNLSSVAATLGSPGEYLWYAGSKGAVESITLGLAREVAGEGIRVNAVAPGLIATGIHAAGGDAGRIERIAPDIPLGRAGTPEEVAETILWLCSEAARYVSGATIRVSGGR